MGPRRRPMIGIYVTALAVSLLLVASSAASGQLSPEAYFEIKTRILDIERQNLERKIELADLLETDPVAFIRTVMPDLSDEKVHSEPVILSRSLFAAVEEQLLAEEARQKQILYEAYATTLPEVSRYEMRHTSAWRSYLARNPELREDLEKALVLWEGQISLYERKLREYELRPLNPEGS